MFTKVSVAALLAGAVAAVHEPTTLGGNPILRPLNEVVPACKAFQITWQPTTSNTVSLLLLRGPSTNVVPIGEPIAEGIANSGSFSWTPSSELEADTTHYGMQLIDDVTGQYQYSTQFGISTDDCADTEEESDDEDEEEEGYPTESSSSAGYGGGYPTETPASSSAHEASSSMKYPQPTANATTPIVHPTSVGTTSHVMSTGAPTGNTSVIMPTNSMSVPETLKTSGTGGAGASATQSDLPESTGAAAALKAGLGFAGAMAAAVMVL